MGGLPELAISTSSIISIIRTPPPHTAVKRDIAESCWTPKLRLSHSGQEKHHMDSGEVQRNDRPAVAIGIHAFISHFLAILMYMQIHVCIFVAWVGGVE
jgi:hypothetical protein